MCGLVQYHLHHSKVAAESEALVSVQNFVHQTLVKQFIHVGLKSRVFVEELLELKNVPPDYVTLGSCRDGGELIFTLELIGALCRCCCLVSFFFLWSSQLLRDRGKLALLQNADPVVATCQPACPRRQKVHEFASFVL